MPHTGDHRDERVYVVGWGTEHEKMFKASDSKRAVSYRQLTDRNLRISQINADQICNRAILDLYSS